MNETLRFIGSLPDLEELKVVDENGNTPSVSSVRAKKHLAAAEQRRKWLWKAFVIDRKGTVRYLELFIYNRSLTHFLFIPQHTIHEN